MKFLQNKRQKLLFYSITALGISSIITQLIVIREFISVFYGNELVFGIILANWLLLTGLGAYLGKYIDKIKHKLRLLIISQIIIALLPFLYITLIRLSRNYIFLPGELISISTIFWFSLFLLLPYCLISGSLLTLACCVFSTKKDPSSIGKVYFIDNIGDILGGFLFSFILIFFLNPFQMVFFIMFVNLIACFILTKFIRRKLLSIFIILILIFSSLIFFYIDLNKITTKLEYKNQELLFIKDSLYGKLVVTKTQDQINFFENGIILFSTENTVANEETVHYALVQHNNPKNVLLISGGVAGTINEILKYNVDKIDYIELDPLIIELGKTYTTNLDSEKVNIINQDWRLFVKNTKEKYDIVIIDLPDPSTAQINRFYTIEFFNELKKILNENAVISISLSASENYYSKEIRELNSALYKTLKTNFKNIIIIPGDKNYFIASDKELSYNIANLIKDKNIETSYVNEYYLPGKITQDRVNYVLESVKEKVRLNKDFSPITYYYHLLFFISHFKFNLLFFLIIFSLLIVFLLIKIKPIPFAIFTTGFAASGLEIIILISFQILYGYVYHMIGVIVTMFMLGLAIGSYYMNKKLKQKTIKSLLKIEFSIFIFAILLPIILILLNTLKNKTLVNLSAWILIPALTILLAILVGLEFPLAAKLQFKKVSHTAGILYSADLIGACIGALLVGALLIPLLGLVKVCILIGILNLVSFAVVYLRKIAI